MFCRSLGCIQMFQSGTYSNVLIDCIICRTRGNMTAITVVIIGFIALDGLRVGCGLRSYYHFLHFVVWDVIPNISFSSFELSQDLA